jgi:nucleotide-binding universal stress UspA family protein
MLPIKKILCPVDFSEPSYRALEVAGELASNFSAELYVIHVITENINFDGLVNILSLDVKSIQRRILDKYKRKLRELIEEKVSTGVRVEPIVFEGIPAYDIVKIAKLENPDVIVMATHGQTGWRHLVFGSVAERVVRLTKYPVLTINAPHEQKKMI